MRHHRVVVKADQTTGWLYATCECGYHSLDYPPLNGAEYAKQAANVHIDQMIADRIALDEKQRVNTGNV